MGKALILYMPKGHAHRSHVIDSSPLTLGYGVKQGACQR